MRTRALTLSDGHAATLEIPDDITDLEVDAWLETKPTISYYTLRRGEGKLVTDTIRAGVKFVPPETEVRMRNVSIDDISNMVESGANVTIEPNGDVIVKPGIKPLTMRENLGGEYGR